MEGIACRGRANTKHQLCHAGGMKGKRDYAFYVVARIRSAWSDAAGARGSWGEPHIHNNIAHGSTKGNAPTRFAVLHRPHSGIATNIGGHRHRCAPQHKYSNCDQNPFEVLHSFSFLSSCDFLPALCREIIYGKPWHIHSWAERFERDGRERTHHNRATTISCTCQLAGWMRTIQEGDARVYILLDPTIMNLRALPSIPWVRTSTCSAGPLAPQLRIGQHLDIHAPHHGPRLKANLPCCYGVVPVRHRDPVRSLV